MYVNSNQYDEIGIEESEYCRFDMVKQLSIEDSVAWIVSGSEVQGGFWPSKLTGELSD